VQITVPGFEQVSDGKSVYFVCSTHTQSPTRALAAFHLSLLLSLTGGRACGPWCLQEYIIEVKVGPQGWILMRRFKEFAEFNISVRSLSLSHTHTHTHTCT
jgi:hypothetical protein